MSDRAFVRLVRIMRVGGPLLGLFIAQLIVMPDRLYSAKAAGPSLIGIAVGVVVSYLLLVWLNRRRVGHEHDGFWSLLNSEWQA